MNMTYNHWSDILHKSCVQVQVQVFYFPNINIWYDIQFLCSSFLERGWTKKHNLLSCENAHRNNPIHRPHCILKITVFCVAHYSSSVKFLYMSRCSLYRKTLGLISTLLNDMSVKFNERHGDANIRQLDCMFKSLLGVGVGGGVWGWWWWWGCGGFSNAYHRNLKK